MSTTTYPASERLQLTRTRPGPKPGLGHNAPPLMSRERLNQIMRYYHWTPTILSKQLQCQPKVVRRWLGLDPATTEQVIPIDVGDWLEELASCYERHPPPPPSRWKRKPR